MSARRTYCRCDGCGRRTTCKADAPCPLGWFFVKLGWGVYLLACSEACKTGQRWKRRRPKIEVRA